LLMFQFEGTWFINYALPAHIFDLISNCSHKLQLKENSYYDVTVTITVNR
jgi:hypothetical protein